MNKKFIGMILGQSYGIISNLNKSQIKKQNTTQIPSQKSKELITSSDLQEERMTQFEKDLSQKQSEFTNAMSLPVPPVPNFSDSNLDEPIGEMELALKKVLEQRNYDIEQVSKNLNKSNADSWLKSQETSLKSEKISSNPSNNSNTIKYIKIENENIENTAIKKDIIDLNQKKNISWGEDENINIKIVEYESDENALIEDDIFKKLKKIDPEPEIFSNTNINTNINTNFNINSRINILEDKIEGLNTKVDLILKLLQEKK